MKPENYKERIYSIIKFAILFVFTVFLIVLSFFFDFNKLPIKENRTLREQALTIEKETEFQQEFSKQMMEIKVLIDSLDDSPKKDVELISNSASKKINLLLQMIPEKDTTFRQKMYNNIVQTYYDLRDAKEELKDFEEVEEHIKNLESNIESLTIELEKARRDNDIYRNRSRY